MKKEYCEACGKEIVNETHAGLCSECMWSNRKPRITITKYGNPTKVTRIY